MRWWGERSLSECTRNGAGAASRCVERVQRSGKPESVHWKRCRSNRTRTWASDWERESGAHAPEAVCERPRAIWGELAVWERGVHAPEVVWSGRALFEAR